LDVLAYRRFVMKTSRQCDKSLEEISVFVKSCH
jgi:hypothetical protein